MSDDLTAHPLYRETVTSKRLRERYYNLDHEVYPLDTRALIDDALAEVERLEGEIERLRKAMPKAAKHLDVHNVLRWSLRELCPETHDDAVALYGDYLLNCRAEEWNGFSPGDRAQWLLQRWLAFSQATYCSYCNAEFQADTDDAILRAHIKECPHHPLSKVYARADRLAGAMVDAAIPGCSCGSCTRLRDALAADECDCGSLEAIEEGEFDE